jgi:very-short-patch-repair endonuclease
MGELRIMGAKGDSKHIWNPRDPDETAAAKAVWDDLVGKKRFLGFKVKRGGEPGERITEFDSEAGKLIITPPMAGGS